MTGSAEQATYSKSLLAGDAEAIKHLEQEIAGGRHWYIALLEAMGMWGSAVEIHHDVIYRYLVQGEAFDWLLLAERLCDSVDGLLPVEEKEALLFHARPPVKLRPEEVKALIGMSKYRQYLNYFYGVTVEQVLVMAVEEEVLKERRVSGFNSDVDMSDEAYRRVYGETRQELLRCFRKEAGYPQKKSTTLSEMKEFAYWLFKYRVEQCESAKVASDTRKALEYLKRQWASEGIFGVLAAEDLSVERPRW
jgi:hypothetical protein